MGRIVVDPDAVAGKPVIRGTRIEWILELTAAGRSETAGYQRLSMPREFTRIRSLEILPLGSQNAPAKLGMSAVAESDRICQSRSKYA